MTGAAVWLTSYVYIFVILTYLTTINQCLTIFFSKKYVSLERSSLDEVKKSIKPFKKKICQKCQWLTFNKYLYIDNKFFIEKSVNPHHFLIDEKNWQTLGLTGGSVIYLFIHTT